MARRLDPVERSEVGRSCEIDLLPHTTLSPYSNVDITTIDELTGTMDALTGTANALSPSSTPKTTIVYGTLGGQTNQFDKNAKDDRGTTIIGTYDSPAIVPIGEEVEVGGQRHIITENDVLAVDEIAATLADYGDTYTVELFASGDGGVNWTSLGTTTVTTNGGTELAPRLVSIMRHARLAVGPMVQVRIRNITAGVRWGFADITPKIDVVGEKR